MKTLQLPALALLLFLVSSSKLEAQWNQCQALESATCSAILNMDTILFAGTSFGDGGYTGVWTSTNNANNWEPASNGLPDSGNYAAFARWDNRVYTAANNGAGVFVTTDKGQNWRSLNNGLQSGYVNAILVGPTTIIACTDLGICRSSDSGGTWQIEQSGLPTHSNVSSIVQWGGGIYIGTIGDGVYSSTDDGVTWIALNKGLTNLSISSLAANGNSLFAGTFEGEIFRTTGVNWGNAYSGIGGTRVNCLFADDDIIYAGTLTFGIYYSVDNGTTWTAANEDFPSPEVNVITANYELLLAGTRSDGIWRRRLSDFAAVHPNANATHTLDCKTYPNPACATTNFTFDLSTSAFTTLTIVDALGHEAQTPLSASMSAGRHELTWDAKNLPSGVYQYRLTSGNESITRKLVLMK